MALRRWELINRYGHVESIFDVAFNPVDPMIFATCSYDSSVKLWSMATMECVGSFVGLGGVIHGGSWSPDGKLFACCASPSGVMILDIENGKQLMRVRNMHAPNVDVVRIAWNPAVPNLILSSGGDGVAVVWDVRGNVQRRVTHNAPATGVCWHPGDGKVFATGCYDGNVYLWKLDLQHDDTSGAPPTPMAVLSGHTDRIFNIVWHPTHHDIIASGSNDRTIRIWSISKRKCLSILRGHTHCVRALTWHPALPSVLVSGSWDGTLRMWDATGVAVQCIGDHHSHVYGLAIHPATPFIMVSCSRDMSVRLWRLPDVLGMYSLSSINLKNLGRLRSAMCTTDRAQTMKIVEGGGVFDAVLSVKTIHDRFMVEILEAADLVSDSIHTVGQLMARLPAVGHSLQNVARLTRGELEDVCKRVDDVFQLVGRLLAYFDYRMGLEELLHAVRFHVYGRIFYACDSFDKEEDSAVEDVPTEKQEEKEGEHSKQAAEGGAATPAGQACDADSDDEEDDVKDRRTPVQGGGRLSDLFSAGIGEDAKYPGWLREMLFHVREHPIYLMDVCHRSQGADWSGTHHYDFKGIGESVSHQSFSLQSVRLQHHCIAREVYRARAHKAVVSQSKFAWTREGGRLRAGVLSSLVRAAFSFVFSGHLAQAAECFVMCGDWERGMACAAGVSLDYLTQLHKARAKGLRHLLVKAKNGTGDLFDSWSNGVAATVTDSFLLEDMAMRFMVCEQASRGIKELVGVASYTDAYVLACSLGQGENLAERVRARSDGSANGAIRARSCVKAGPVAVAVATSVADMFVQRGFPLRAAAARACVDDIDGCLSALIQGRERQVSHIFSLLVGVPTCATVARGLAEAVALRSSRWDLALRFLRGRTQGISDVLDRLLSSDRLSLVFLVATYAQSRLVHCNDIQVEGPDGTILQPMYHSQCADDMSKDVDALYDLAGFGSPASCARQAGELASRVDRTVGSLGGLSSLAAATGIWKEGEDAVWIAAVNQVHHLLLAGKYHSAIAAAITVSRCCLLRVTGDYTWSTVKSMDFGAARSSTVGAWVAVIRAVTFPLSAISNFHLYENHGLVMLYALYAAFYDAMWRSYTKVLTPLVGGLSTMTLRLRKDLSKVELRLVYECRVELVSYLMMADREEAGKAVERLVESKRLPKAMLAEVQAMGTMLSSTPTSGRTMSKAVVAARKREQEYRGLRSVHVVGSRQIVSGDQYYSHFSSERIDGGAVRFLEDGNSVLSVSEWEMWVSVCPFSPLLTGESIFV